MMAYLAMMAIRLIELHRVLKPTGSLYLHCDPTASHYLKILLDAVFGAPLFRNEISWKRTGHHGSARRWAPVHDTLLFYSKSENYCWNKTLQAYDPFYVQEKFRNTDIRGKFQDVSLTGAGTRRGESGQPWRGYDPTERGRHWAIPAEPGAEIDDFSLMSVQQRLDALDAAELIYWPRSRDGSIGFPRIKQYPFEGQAIQDCVIDISALNSQAQERLGYPTQKPVALLERIVAASSNPGDVVLDPFCGCGTTIHAAQKLGRQWIGIDITHLAISLIERRLRDAFGKDVQFETIGVPKDIGAARDLAARDKHEFEKWAITLVPDAQPFRGGKKGADTGIDGIVYMRTEKNRTDKAIIEVKGGGVSVDQIHKLKSVIEREKALTGIFLTLNPPTKPMIAEAAAAGFSETQFGRIPKIQILTIEGILDHREFPRLPAIDSSAFKKAPREKNKAAQSDFEF